MFTKLHNLHVKFRHNPEQGVTECYAPTENESMFVGARAKCSKNDTFSKVKGRKLALLRLMKAVGLTRSQRFVEWEAYRLMTKTPRWPRTEMNKR